MYAFGVAIGTAFIVGLVTVSLIWMWAPLFHWTCVDQTQVAREGNAFVPVALVNSPYGGRAVGNASMAWNFPGAWNGPPPPPGDNFRVGWGTSSANGTTNGAFYMVNVSLYRVEDAVEWGPGTNARCAGQVRIQLQAPTIYGATSTRVPTPSDLSDYGEATNLTIYPGQPNARTTPFFNNSFTGSNTRDVSTCGTASLVLPVTTSFLTVTFRFDVSGQNYSIPFALPFLGAFNYTFPANFGTWQVDNLSAPGGPGGGWAFNYVGACP
jgi:hypothetical protein